MKIIKECFHKLFFFWSTLICADLRSKVHDLGLDRYSIGQISYGTLSCRVISGRLIRHNAVINPTCHKIFFLRNDSPLVKLAVKESHDRLGCALGLLQYVKNAQLISVTTPAIMKTVKELRNSCAGCLQQRVFFNAKSPYSQHIL